MSSTWLLDRINGIFADPSWFAIFAFLIIIAITLHEWGHAVMAQACGDPTPKMDGRVTLNPIVHLDPIGTIGIFLFGFGWGRPVMVQPANFRNRRWDDVKVSAAGPAMNLFQAIVFAIALRTMLQLDIDAPVAERILGTGLAINIMLMVFNLIPVGPLDGATIVKGFLPLQAAYDFHRFNQQWGLLLMIGLLFTGAARWFIEPVQHVFRSYILWGLT